MFASAKEKQTCVSVLPVGLFRGNGPAPVLFPILVASPVIYLTQSEEQAQKVARRGKPVFMTRKNPSTAGSIGGFQLQRERSTA